MHFPLSQTRFHIPALLLALLLAIQPLAPAQDPEPFQWSGGGDAANWSDSANWAGGSVPYSQGSFGSHNRPNLVIDQTGAEVTIDSKIPKAFGHINVGASGEGATLNIVEGGALSTQGSVVIGGDESTGHLNVSGGWIEIGVWGARDLNITDGSFTFGSEDPETAPSITVKAPGRGFIVAAANRRNAELTLHGHGSIVTAQRAIFSLYGGSTVNVVGGNLNLHFGAEEPTESRIGGKGHPSRTAKFIYTLDAAGASTMQFGGDVAFGESSFELKLAEDFSANPGDVFTIVTSQGDFIENRAFGNVADGFVINAGDYKFKAAYSYAADGPDSFTLIVQGD